MAMYYVEPTAAEIRTALSIIHRLGLRDARRAGEAEDQGLEGTADAYRKREDRLRAAYITVDDCLNGKLPDA